jgi:hypothetical protein
MNSEPSDQGPRPPAGWRIGRYRVESVLGTGAFATVYQAVDERLGDTVAVKVLAENHSPDPEIRKRFLTEGRVLRRIDSPHVLDVHDLGQTDRHQPFLVLEYASRGTLAQRARDLGAQGWRPTFADVLAVARPLAHALDAIHRAGVVHRDVNPGNVLLTTRGAGGRLRGQPRRSCSGSVSGSCWPTSASARTSPSTPATRAVESAPRASARPSCAGAPPSSTTAPTSGRCRRWWSGSPPAHHPAPPRSRGPGSRPDWPARWAAASPTTPVIGIPTRSPGWPTSRRRWWFRRDPGPGSGAWTIPTIPTMPAMSAMPAMAPPGPWTPPPGYGPGPGASSSTWPTSAPSVQPPASWRLRQSAWVLTALGLGLTTWIGFLYVGARSGRTRWLWAAGAYGAGALAIIVLDVMTPVDENGDSEPGSWQTTVGIALLMFVWIGGLVHALLANRDWLRYRATSP